MIKGAKDLCARLDELLGDLLVFAPQTCEPRTFEGLIHALRHVIGLVKPGLDYRSGSEPFTQPELVVLGRLIAGRRRAAKITRRKLAQLAQLSDSTLKNIECAKLPPTRRSLWKIWQVPVMKLTAAEWPQQAGVGPESQQLALQVPASVTLSAGAVKVVASAFAVGRAVSRRREDSSATSLDEILRIIDAETVSPTEPAAAMIGTTDFIAASYSIACARTVPFSSASFLQLISEAVREVDRPLSFEIFQIRQWSYLHPESAVEFSNKAPLIRRWSIAGLYGYLWSGGRAREAMACAAMLASEPALACALANVLCFAGTNPAGNTSGSEEYQTDDEEVSGDRS